MRTYVEAGGFLGTSENRTTLLLVVKTVQRNVVKGSMIHEGSNRKIHQSVCVFYNGLKFVF